METSPSTIPIIKPAVIMEIPIIISNKIIITLNKVFFFISSPPIILYNFEPPNTNNHIRYQ